MNPDLESLLLSDELDEETRSRFLAELESRAEPLHFNGVNGATGGYGLEPMSGAAFADCIRGLERIGENDKQEAAARSNPGNRAHPIRPGNDPARLDQAGWAVIFPAKADAAPYKEALKPLLDLRQQQAGERFRIYEGGQGYRPGEDKRDFFKRAKVSEGPADPKQMPYYVLLVGDPEEIPYSFQYQLDVMRGVGRIYFETIEEYANYAQSVVRAERGEVELPRQVSFFGVSNPDDKATEMSTRFLIKRLHELLNGRPEYKAESGGDAWRFDSFLKEEATKEKLAQLLGGPQRPAVLFTASHGMEFPKGHPLQLRHQGALLCQDWPGPRRYREHSIPESFYFSGDDLDSQQSLLGMVAVFFACYGAGTPRLDQFARQAGKSVREEIAPQSFVARLPRKLLSHPKGGALAVVGHVERAWGYSFLSPDCTAHTNSFEDTVREVMGRQRVGWSTESLNLRYADKATELSSVLEEESYEDTPKKSPYELAGLWTANNDARGYVVLGDPAVQLPLVGTRTAKHAEPTLTITTASKPAEAPTATPAQVAPPTTPAQVAAPVPQATQVTQESKVSAPVADTAKEPVAAEAPPQALPASIPSGDPGRIDAALARISDVVAAALERSAGRLATLEATDVESLAKLVELARSLRSTSR